MNKLNNIKTISQLPPQTLPTIFLKNMHRRTLHSKVITAGMYSVQKFLALKVSEFKKISFIKLRNNIQNQQNYIDNCQHQTITKGLPGKVLSH